MGLEEKIEYFLNTLERSSNSLHVFKLYYQTSEDQHEKVDYIFGSKNGVAKYLLNFYLKSFKQYEECIVNCSNGEQIRIVDIIELKLG